MFPQNDAKLVVEAQLSILASLYSDGEHHAIEALEDSNIFTSN